MTSANSVTGAMERLRALTSIVACAAFALVARGGDASIDDKVDAFIPGLLAAEPAARKSALDALQKLGVPALPSILRAAGRDVGSPAFEAAIAAAAAIDADQALAAVQSCRTSWSSLGWLGQAEGRKGRTVVESIEDRLLAARKVTWSKPAKLQPATLDDGFRVPPWVDTRVADALPSHLAWADVPCRERSGRLEIDTGLDGRFATKVEPGKSLVVSVGPKERARRVLVHSRQGAWYAASPNVLRGDIGRAAVELLDPEGDGDFTGPADLVRFGDAPFRPLREGPFAWIDGALVRFRLRREDGALTISFMPEPEPRWLDASSAAGMSALHQWRSAFGLAPQRLDAERWRHCGLHHEFWRLNGFTAHDEYPDSPGYTAEGARAGQSASAWEVGDGPEFVRRIGGSVLHRSSLVGRPEDGVGFFVGPRGSLLWGGTIDGGGRGFPVLVPAAGQTRVPQNCEPENPTPSKDPAFYQRAHGFPVSVTWSGLAVRPTAARSLEVFEPGATKPLPGVTFSEENPYNDGFRGGYPDDSVIFVADAPLPANTLFTARFRATGTEGPIEFTWQFRTQ